MAEIELTNIDNGHRQLFNISFLIKQSLKLRKRNYEEDELYAFLLSQYLLLSLST